MDNPDDARREEARSYSEIVSSELCSGSFGVHASGANAGIAQALSNLTRQRLERLVQGRRRGPEGQFRMGEQTAGSVMNI